MGKCGLSIELENPTTAYYGGDKVRGHVRIDADADVRCRSLDVYAGWRTRGMGNVASEHGPKLTLFSGPLVAGESQRFPFEVEMLSWPPTYHGFHLNIEHFIEATADIPWATDPKESVPIHLLPSQRSGGEAAAPQPPTKAVYAFLFIFACAFVTMFAVAFLGPKPWVLLGAPALVVTGTLGLLLVYRWLPRLYVGQVQFDLQPRRVVPGEVLSGSFSICPTRAIEPQFIHFHLIATEVCVSGSGTNQKTHRHELFARQIVLADKPTLHAGETVHFKILTHLPPVAAYSMKLTHNELHWLGRIHVGIAGLVDWQEDIYLNVVPPAQRGVAGALAPGLQAAQFVDQDYLAPPPGGDRAAADAHITFAETVGYIAEARDSGQNEQVALLVDAVAGLPLSFTARIARRPLHGDEAAALLTQEALLAHEPLAHEPLFHEDQVVWAEHEDPPLPLSLHVSAEQAAMLEPLRGRLWTGQGEVIGWDPRGGRLQVRVHG